MSKSLYDYCIETNKLALLAEWDTEQNGSLTPKLVAPSSHKDVWWRCEQGHVWQATVYGRAVHNKDCPICANRIPLPGYNTLADVNPELAAQWHPTKNDDLTPSMMFTASPDKVWWVCDKGHEWQATISSRSKGAGCPVCANKKIMVGLNDLATTHPKIAQQWNYERNGSLSPQDVFAGSKNKVWWICEKGHEYLAATKDRTFGNTGCPFCAGRKVLAGFNDLATKFPDIAAQWHPTKNCDISPENVVPYSNKKAWWICEKGHEYYSTIASRTSRSRGCPICDGKKVLAGFNDLATKDPMLATQWYQELNGDLTPEMVTPGCNKKAWWRCPNGHIWQAYIYSRATGRKCGCPVCAGVVNTKRTARYRIWEEDTHTK